MAGNSNCNRYIDDNSAEDNKDAGKSEKNVESVLYERSQYLAEIANNTFKELYRTLENEQTKLNELEERRKQLQEEMQRLKVEIEVEKQSYSLNVVESVVDNSCSSSTPNMDTSGFSECIQVDSEKILNDSGSVQMLDTCYEEDETDEQERGHSGSIEPTNNIEKQLH